MGWKKEIKQETGVLVKYWEIDKIEVDVLNNFVIIQYKGWLSKAEKLAGSKPIVAGGKKLDENMGLKVTNDFVKRCEQLLKDADFVGAVEE